MEKEEFCLFFCFVCLFYLWGQGLQNVLCKKKNNFVCLFFLVGAGLVKCVMHLWYYARDGNRKYSCLWVPLLA